MVDPIGSDLLLLEGALPQAGGCHAGASGLLALTGRGWALSQRLQYDFLGKGRVGGGGGWGAQKERRSWWTPLGATCGWPCC